jgi:hypothetical protein
MLILSCMLAFAWIGVASIDIFYYRRLLKGAVDAILALERESGGLNLSTKIEERAHWGGNWAPWVFYICGLLPLLGIISWAICQLSALPDDVPTGG